MTTAVPDILARIVEHKRAWIPSIRSRLSELESRASARMDRRDFSAAISAAPAIIAEAKKASPSKGLLARPLRSESIAQAYERGGAAALSVLTDERYFQGSLGDLEQARAACRIPVLRKDFTVDPAQITEAAAHGADAVLLIAAILTDRELVEFRETAERQRIAALVEVHDQNELHRAAGSGARIIGVNNRDLRTFEVRIETSLRLADRFPEGAIRVAESGIHFREHIHILRDAGYQAFLVGERLMTSGDPEGALRDLLA